MVANAVEKSNQIITKASILFYNGKAIISDSVNIVDSIRWEMIDLAGARKKSDHPSSFVGGVLNTHVVLTYDIINFQ